MTTRARAASARTTIKTPRHPTTTTRDPRTKATARDADRVGTIFGTMTLGWRYASETCDDETSTAMLRTFVRDGDGRRRELDTAIAYAGGETERILGRAFASDGTLRASDAVVDTLSLIHI